MLGGGIDGLRVLGLATHPEPEQQDGDLRYLWVAYLVGIVVLLIVAAVLG